MTTELGYRILGIQNDISAKELKSRFRTLVKKYHPDVNSSKDAPKKLISIVEAYEVVCSDINVREANDYFTKLYAAIKKRKDEDFEREIKVHITSEEQRNIVRHLIVDGRLVERAALHIKQCRHCKESINKLRKELFSYTGLYWRKYLEERFGEIE